jgi:hypothetical protein
MTDPVVVYLVHGTFARKAPWMREGSHLVTALHEAFGARLTIERFVWSGANSFRARANAARELARQWEAFAKANPSAKIFVIAHSHGGNVASYAMRQCRCGDRIRAMTTLATPFFESVPRWVRLGVLCLEAAVFYLGIVATLSAFIRWAVNPALDYAHNHSTGTWRWVFVLGVALLLGNWGKGLITLLFELVGGVAQWATDTLELWQDRLVERAELPRSTSMPTLCIALQADEARAWLTATRIAKSPFEFTALASLAIVALATMGLAIVWTLELCAPIVGLALFSVGHLAAFKSFLVLDAVLRVVGALDICALIACMGCLIALNGVSLLMAGHPLAEGTNNFLAPILVRTRMTVRPAFARNLTVEEYSVRALWGKSVFSPFRPELAHSWAHSLPALVDRVVAWLVHVDGDPPPALAAGPDPDASEGTGPRLERTEIRRAAVRTGCAAALGAPPALVLVLLAVAWLTGKAVQRLQVGDDCRYAEDDRLFPRCLDAGAALMCGANGKLGAIPCGGPAGCGHRADAGSEEGASTCDLSVGRAGDACPAARMTCSEDGISVLECRDGTWQPSMRCRGPGACKVVTVDAGDSLTCDMSVAVVGEACQPGGSCSTDHEAMLDCVGGHWVAKADCLGPQGCTVTGTRIACDQSAGRVGGRCEKGHSVCATDGAELLSCRDGHYVLDRECRGPHHCTAETADCDQAFAEPHDACESGSIACSVDQRSLLRCMDSRFDVVDRCPARMHCRYLVPHLSIQCL